MALPHIFVSFVRNGTFENKKDKISSQGKVLTKVIRDADNWNDGN